MKYRGWKTGGQSQALWWNRVGGERVAVLTKFTPFVITTIGFASQKTYCNMFVNFRAIEEIGGLDCFW